MGKLIDRLKRVRLVYRRSSSLTKTVVLSAIVLSMAALLTLNLTVRAARQEAEDLGKQAAQLEQENQKLKENIAGLGSVEGVEQIARDELGLVKPDTVIIEPEESVTPEE